MDSDSRRGSQDPWVLWLSSMGFVIYHAAKASTDSRTKANNHEALNKSFARREVLLNRPGVRGIDHYTAWQGSIAPSQVWTVVVAQK